MENAQDGLRDEPAASDATVAHPPLRAVEGPGWRVPCSELRHSRILVVAAEPLNGIAIKALLESLGLVAIYVPTVAAAAELPPSPRDILVWLADFVDAESLAAARELKRRQARMGLCLIANGADPGALRDLLADDPERFGLVARRRNPNALVVVAALSRVARGQGTVDGTVLRHILSSDGPDPVALDRLSAVEREVLELLAQGYRNREIARRLWKSEKTVEKHIAQVFQKLDLEARATTHLDRRVAAARIFLSHTARTGW
jgi:DNA-binding NarL/FixJ family response regulator